MTVSPESAQTAAERILSTPVPTFIDGKERVSDKQLDLVDPGTGEKFGSLSDASSTDVESAVTAARDAFEDGRWSQRDPDDRQAVLLRLADLIDRDAEIMTRVEAVDTGKPLEEARFDIKEASTVIRYYAGWATKYAGEVIPSPRSVHASTSMEPLGVCAAITPWNYPLPILTYKLAPAIAAGNTFVSKPSELAPVSTVMLARLAIEAGLPEGVFNVVPGAGATGSALSSSANIDKLSFTGSTNTGRAILRSTAETITPTTVELGGKSAQIVFDDCDLEAAVDGVMRGIWTNSGQVCVAGTRVLVHERIEDEFLSNLSERTAKLRLGHSLADGSDLGPVISKRQYEGIAKAIDQASADGAEIVQPVSDKPNAGYFIPPTILLGLRQTAPAITEEIFGPVLAVSTFRDEDEAITMANGTRYGLAAGVWSENVSRVLRVTRALQVGTVWANTYGMFHPTLPFGGFKSSGFGRELGGQAMAAYTQSKTSVIHVGGIS